MSIEEAQTTFINSFNELDDWFMQYELLLEIAGTTPVPDPSDKNEKTKIHGCQTDAWLVLKTDGERLFITADSESLIIRGILGIFVMLLQHQTLKEVAASDLCFIEKTALKEQLSTDRFMAMQRVREKIAAFCHEKTAAGKEGGN